MMRLIALMTVLSLVGMLTSGCYNTYIISKDELGKLQSGQESQRVAVQSMDGENVDISPESPLEVETIDGQSYRVTPFNFLLSESQLVSPDYDLLLNADTIQDARVREISYTKTFTLIGVVAAGVIGGFVALSL